MMRLKNNDTLTPFDIYPAPGRRIQTKNEDRPPEQAVAGEAVSPYPPDSTRDHTAKEALGEPLCSAYNRPMNTDASLG